MWLMHTPSGSFTIQHCMPVYIPEGMLNFTFRIKPPDLHIGITNPALMRIGNCRLQGKKIVLVQSDWPYRQTPTLPQTDLFSFFVSVKYVRKPFLILIPLRVLKLVLRERSPIESGYKPHPLAWQIYVQSVCFDARKGLFRVSEIIWWPI